MAGEKRRRIDSVLAWFIVTIETLLLATLWGPQPAAWLWVGSQINYYTDSVMAGIGSAFAGMLASIFLTIVVAKRLDLAWQLVRRAAGHTQKEGMLTRIFVVSAMIGVSVFSFWFIILNGPGSSAGPAQAG
jgi:hypothetical protein